MKNRWMISGAAMLSLVGGGILGIGCITPTDDATVGEPTAAEALQTPSTDEAAVDDSMGEAKDAIETPATSDQGDVGSEEGRGRFQCYLDRCFTPHQACTCSNTGWAGYCGTGTTHPGCLYCRCSTGG
ncbi:hypothetical protein [Chondromyces crocatus]|uniref:Uncharacterized protein n=1 Tax=Chondromyces crocatus TaxID=52 RepID=A0A0K1EC02_CHOCO|nr:hypothetical protein [Chondromyces crocatus]AKT38400.1 uncharacterized protein CMC5_025460 [Chondromyces crocatus]